VAYTLGVDLGTTYTAAAVAEGGGAEIVPLGRRQAAVPTVVYIGTDRVLVGEAAVQRAVDEPERVAREFKRRVGDPVPLVLGGSPWSAEQLLARVLAWVLDRVATERGSPPDRLAVTYPARWRRWKRDVLDEALHLVASVPPVTTVSEPEAAAVHYATSNRLDPGESIAIYDLGGGSFDLSILRAVAGGFEFVGSPDGIERMGGIDFDEVVYRHVLHHATEGGYDAEADADTDDPVTLGALARLRDACVDAKEAMSFDTRVAVPVMLPGVTTTVGITRSEFEEMIGPPLEQTVAVLKRALESAGMSPAELRAVVLVGGSSRIPLVGQVVSGALGRPVAVDAHPKHPVALGAALVAGRDRPAAWPASATPPPFVSPLPIPAKPVPAPPPPAEPVRWPYPAPADTPSPIPASAPVPPAPEETVLEPVAAPRGDDEPPRASMPRWVVPLVTLAVLALVLVIAVLAR
jgi:molecular chaperone DnaK (HSP70)